MVKETRLFPWSRANVREQGHPGRRRVGDTGQMAQPERKVEPGFHSS